jgi:hypothetical protein
MDDVHYIASILNCVPRFTGPLAASQCSDDPAALMRGSEPSITSLSFFASKFGDILIRDGMDTAPQPECPSDQWFIISETRNFTDQRDAVNQ